MEIYVDMIKEYGGLGVKDLDSKQGYINSYIK